jgi:hypothetical protein
MFLEEMISVFCGLPEIQDRIDGQKKWTRKVDMKKNDMKKMAVFRLS